jgi:ABC-type antimicrobial peptide transport system permease subunit
MFYLRYIAAELRRRRGRTILTSLGLAIGVGLVVTVTALSAGLDDAQSEVLDPLTGVGTDMSVDRPLAVEGSGEDQQFTPGSPGAGLSAKEQRQLERENGGARFGLQNLGDPGERFEDDNFMSTDLSFPANEQKKIAAVDGVAGVAGGLTLSAIHITGTVPKESETDQGALVGPPAAGGAPNSINLEQSTVSGVDLSEPDLGLLTAGQVVDGSYFKGRGRDQAVLSVSYANENDTEIGDKVTVGGHEFKVVGLSTAAVGGEASDVYVELGQLQKLSDREGRVNVLQVRADSADNVASVADAIESGFNGAEVTTADELADQVSGSLVDAKDLTSKLGTALAIVALGAAFGIASLLTLSSVNKRIRELGTLKALGWRQWLVVRQVSGESVTQGLIGGAAGALLGIGGAVLIGVLGISLDASIAAEQSGLGPPSGGPFGQGAVEQTASTVSLGAPIDLQMILMAIALAVLGGLIAGAVGGMRAARLRPAEALRSVE